jgi:hypothetical protein
MVSRIVSQRVFWSSICLFLVSNNVNGFLVRRATTTTTTCPGQLRTASTASSVRLFQSQQDKNQENYSRDLLLREEVESPFRKARFFLYAGLGAGAFISLLLSLARIAAAASGINTDLLQESAANAAIDAGGLALLFVLWQNDVKAQQSRLQRASKGAEIAKLQVRASKVLLDEGETGTFTTTLASMRRGRGLEKRVVIVAGTKENIDQVLQLAGQLQDDLALNDLLLVPVVLPQAVPPATADSLPSCVALPVGAQWKTFMDDEVQEAEDQEVDWEREGFCIILKKNGRVGQRTRGIFLENMVGEVTKRREAGMDVTNI